MSFAGLVGYSKVGAGIVIGPGAVTVRVQGAPLSLIGDKVSPHGSGAHANAYMIQGSMKVRVGGRPVCRVGHQASCADPMISGSLKVRIHS